ncbi:hypothetical protein EJ02DRAFT_456059 [Clathrospora elynae]|uniref:Uncharacterized protein n=1 Tax=Clathrospora elynae TaxID=706981 RepID=A0A6A5SJW3_9PLEO|nr:hypothetical protein EJ02DRAFT_456059 [Clathrospora elynae]
MKLNGFELFAFFLCSSLSGLLFSVWANTELINDREVTLLMVVFAAVVFALFVQLSTGRAINVYFSKDAGEVYKKQLADVKESHRRHLTTLKQDHHIEVHHLRSSLNTANAKYIRLHSEHDYMSSMYQDQMHATQEQEDRIHYLDKKLQEFGQSTPVNLAPFSAPPSQVSFSNPPRRRRSHSFSKSPATRSPLSQVVEAEEE